MHERFPQSFIRPSSKPSDIPLFGIYPVELAPVFPLRGKKRLQAVPQFSDWSEFRKRQKRDRIAPWIELAVKVKAHARGTPFHRVLQAEVVQRFERVGI